MQRAKTTILDIQAKKNRGQPITMLTAYDYTGALLVDAAGIDMILVGDSLGMVIMGLDSTVPVTMDDMVHHCRAVSRGSSYAFLVGDMPFMSYQADISEAVRNAGRLMKESSMDAVKLEGGQPVIGAIKAINDAGIPVMGHLGLTPQSQSSLGGYRVQGRTAAAAMHLYEDAVSLQDAGCFSIVLEAVPAAVADAITENLDIPTIGIGAGANCDGQVLVFHDVLGLFDRLNPRFVKEYATLRPIIVEAFETYRNEVASRSFPAEDHVYKMTVEEYKQFLHEIQQGFDE